MDNIDTLLKERGLTKTALAELLGIKKQNVNALLKNPTYETQKRIARAIGVEVWELFVSPQKMASVNPASNSITCPYCGNKISLNPAKGG